MMDKLTQELKKAAIEHIGRRGKDLDAPLMYSGFSKKTFTSRELMEEIENETPEGKRVLLSFVKLAVDLLERGKEEIDGYKSADKFDA